MQIEVKHLLATTGYPQYIFPWVKVGDNTFGWDGVLFSNSLIREVLVASPMEDKHVFMVENYPRLDRLPANMTKYNHVFLFSNIMFCDKTASLINLSRLITKQVHLETLYEVLHQCNHSHLSKEQMAEIEESYELLVRSYGAKILSLTQIIQKNPERPYSQQNADFSIDTIKQITNEGEVNGLEELESLQVMKESYLLTRYKNEWSILFL